MLSTGSIPETLMVSIAMATYNGERYLQQQLDTILQQSHAQLEIIIVDDCSTDNTRNILNIYRQKDQRIHLYFNERNTGYKTTFITALQHCTAEYILFCDQDDCWLQHKVETLLRYIGDRLLVFSDSELVNEAGDSMGMHLSDTVSMRQPGKAVVNRGFVTGNCVWGHTILFHRSLLVHAAMENNDHPHDWWLAVVSSLLDKIVFCPIVLNQYRQHGHNVTQAMPGKKGKVPGRKRAEYELQLSRIDSIAALPFNTDQAFYLQWKQLFITRELGFSMPLFTFLLKHRKAVFAFKQKNWFAQVVEIRKMCRELP